MRRSLSALCAFALLGLAPADQRSQSGVTLSVMYAGSLVAVMEKDVGPAFTAQTGVVFAGEPKGSKAIASLIEGGLRNPDVFLSADRTLYPGLVPFGRADLLVAYEPESKLAARFEMVARGRGTLTSLLADPAVHCGRTDPAVDPKGARTLAALSALKTDNIRPDDVFPEEDLLVRVSTGQIDCGFFYATETRTTGLAAVPLPDGIGSRPGIAAEYAIVALPNARHPQAAHNFVEFILHGAGRQLLEKAGLDFIDR